MDELSAASIEEINEQELTEEQELLENAEELIRTFNEADQLLSGADYAITTQLQELRNILRSQKSSLTENLTERINSVLIEMQDVASEISNKAEGIEVNPERLQEVNDKMGLIFNLRSKHRADDVTTLIQLRNDLEDKLSLTQNLSGEIAILEQSIAKQQIELLSKAQQLSKKRKKQAVKIEKSIDDLLEQLGMQHSRLKLSLIHI